MSARAISNIALTGFMGTGKSTVGHLIARQLGYEFLDTDDRIEKLAGKTVSTIFANEGETAFRNLEKALVSELASCQKTVICTGGGLGADLENVLALKKHALVVCLWASPEIIWSRVQNQSHRPLLQEADPLAKIRTLLKAREPVYKEADVLLSTEVRSLREVAQQIMHHFKLAR